MNTTELYVEPVFIGALVLAMLVAPWAPELIALLKPLEGLIGGAILVGASFLVGIVADRLIDSILEAPARHSRLRFACSKVSPEDWDAKGWKDPYPEDELRLRVMRDDTGKLADFLDYVRTRMRLVRAIAALSPGLAYSAVVGLVRWRFRGVTEPLTFPLPLVGLQWQERWGVWLVPLTYAVLLPVGLLIFRALDPLGTWVRKQKRPFRARGPVKAGRWRPPRSDQGDAMKIYAKEERGGLLPDRSDRHLLYDILLQPFSFAALLLLAFAFALAWAGPWQDARAAAATGLGLAFATFWAWWRITYTFMTYVYVSGQFCLNKAVKRTADFGSGV
jgi:hypothetical protein